MREEGGYTLAQRAQGYVVYCGAGVPVLKGWQDRYQIRSVEKRICHPFLGG